MATLNDFNYTDNVHDVLAVYVNRLLAATLRSEYKNVQTLSGDMELTDGDTPIQRLGCDGSNRILKMPSPDAVSNHPYLIINASSGSEILSINSNDDAITHAALEPGKSALMLPDGTGGYVLVGNSVDAEDVVVRSAPPVGMKMIWNSATSLSVGVGACYAENGDIIKITSTLTASSLSLSHTTWYHVYVYLNAGVPAMEVVTTAPTAWEGDAFSKTGDTSRRYVGSVKTQTGGGGNILNFEHNVDMGYIAYKTFNSGAAPFVCLNGGTANGATAIALSGVVPETALIPFVRISNIADKVMRISDNNGVSSTQQTTSLAIGNTAQQTQSLFCPMDASRQIWYLYDSVPGAGMGYLYVLGYLFRR